MLYLFHFSLCPEHCYTNLNLEDCRPRLEEAAKLKWPDVPVAPNMLEVKPRMRCVVIGTVYKEMKLKPNILDEHHARARYEAPPPARSNYTSEDDTVVLEDQKGRVALKCSADSGLSCEGVVTGVLLAVMGSVIGSGEFMVESYCNVHPGPQKELTPPPGEMDPYVALISGLCLGQSAGDATLPLQLFVDYITGMLGGTAEQSHAAKVVRVVIAGNLIEELEAEEEMAAYQLKGVEARTVEHVREVDNLLAQLTSSVPVDVMSGANDPSNMTVPQQPMHRCMFPKAASSTLMKGATNPHDFTLGGASFLGTSGQGVDDVFRFSGLTDRLEIAVKTLQWGHTFPTAPDTLPCFPFFDRDPFVIERTPHVYFAGNQPEFMTKVVEGN